MSYRIDAPADDDTDTHAVAAAPAAAAAQRPLQLTEIAEEDLRNIAEIEQAMDEQLGVDASPTDSWTNEYDEIESAIHGFLNTVDDAGPSFPDEECQNFLEEELQRMETLKTEDVAPTTMSGQLADAAAEFWFPASRDCGCCNGYKHACKCVRVKGFVACQKEGCCTQEFLGVEKKPATASYYTPAQAPRSAHLPPAPAAAPVPLRMSPRVTAPVSAPVPVPASVPQVPQSAPRTGRIPTHATEFWFPASRSCACCQGYKHACECVAVYGFVACQYDGCCTEEFFGVMNEFFMPPPQALQAQQAPEGFAQAQSGGMLISGPDDDDDDSPYAGNYNQQYDNAYYGAGGSSGYDGYYSSDYNQQDPSTHGHHYSGGGRGYYQK